MTPTRDMPETDRAGADIRAMRQELTAVHREVAAILRTMTALLEKVRTLDQDEAALVQEVGHLAADVERRIAAHAAPTHCPTCGSGLDRHAAMAGDLLICATCGWSQFVDRHDGPLAAADPIPAPAVGTSADGPWVA